MLISVILIGVMNIFSGIEETIFYICLFWFIAGCSLNIHTIGKDFLFEFCEDRYWQFALSLDSCFGLLAHLAGPFIGMKIYFATGNCF